MPNEHIRYFGLYAIVAATAFIIFMLIKYRGNKSMTLSLHAASHPTAYVLFGIMATLSAALFYPFLLWWFAPTFRLPLLFSWFVVIIAACQLLIAWIPDRPGVMSKIHTRVAFVAGALALPLTWMIIMSPFITSGLKVFGILYFVLSLLCVFLYFVVSGAKRYSLVLQMSYYWGFFVIVLTASYL